MATKQEIVKIAYEVDLDNLLRAAAKKQGLSEAETKDFLKQAKKRESAAQREIKRRIKAQEKASKQGQMAVRRATKSKIESFKKFGDAAQGEIGSITTRVFNLGEGLIQFGSAAGPLGIATLGFALLATGGVLAIGAISGAMVGLVLKADELNDSIKEYHDLGGFKGAVPPEEMEAVQEFNDQMKALNIVFKQIAVRIAADLAPSLTGIGRIILQLALTGRDAVISLADGFNLLKEGVIFAAKGIMAALTAPISGFKMAIDVFVAFARATGTNTAAVERLAEDMAALDEIIDGFFRKPVDAIFEGLSFVIDSASMSLNHHNEEIDAFFAKFKSERNKGAVGEHSKQIEELGKRLFKAGQQTSGLANAFDKFVLTAASGLASPIEKINIDLEASLSSFETARQALAEHTEKLRQSIGIATEFGLDTGLLKSQLDESLSKLDEYETARYQLAAAASQKISDIRQKESERIAGIDAAQAAEYDAAVEKTVGVVFSAAKDVAKFAQAQADAAKDGTEAQKKAARAAFAINQAVALSSIAINTAQAIMQALGSMPPPFSFVAAGAAGVAGAAQLATVASTPPPTFHIGGGIGTASSAPDEVNIRAKSGEGVLTGAGMRAIGGRDGLTQANRGSSGSSEMVVVQKYQHRSFNAFQEDGVKMLNSPIRRAIKGQKKVGHRGR